MENVNSLSESAVPCASMRPVALSIRSPVEWSETWTTLVPASNVVNTNPSDDAARLDRAQMKGLRSEEIVHPPIRAVGRDQLERNHEEQRQDKRAAAESASRPGRTRKAA